MIKTIFTTILICFYAISFGQETQKFKMDNISFEYPAHWNTYSSEYYIQVKDTVPKGKSFLKYFEITIDTGYIALIDYCKFLEDSVSKIGFEFKVQTKKEIDFKGMKAIDYWCTAVIFDIEVEWKYIIFMNDGNVYKLSSFSRVKVREETSFMEIIDDILESFKIE